MIRQWLLLSSVVALLAIGSVASAHQPTPTPKPSAAASWPANLQPAGDAGVSIQPTASAQPTPAASQPSAQPSASAAQPTPTANPVHDPGPVTIIVLVCVDTNADGRCGWGEGVSGMPFVIVNAQTGARLTPAPLPTGAAFPLVTDGDGRTEVPLTLQERTTISVEIPILAVSQIAYSGQESIVIVIPAPTFPGKLP